MLLDCELEKLMLREIIITVVLVFWAFVSAKCTNNIIAIEYNVAQEKKECDPIVYDT